MLFNGLADLQTLKLIVIDTTNQFAFADLIGLTGKIDIFITGFAVNIVDDIAFIDITTTRQLVKIIVGLDGFNHPLDLAGLHDIHFDLCRDATVIAFGVEQFDVRLVVPIPYIDMGHFNLLHQLLLVSINGIQFIQQVVFLFMGR